MATQRILVPVDFSSLQEPVLAQAVLLARRLDSELILLHCAAPPELSVVAVEPLYVPSEVLTRFTQDQTALSTRKMKEIVGTLPSDIRAETMFRATAPTKGILTAAQSTQCDLIVMGSHGAGMERFLIGSVAEQVVRDATCPVLIARKEPSEMKNVVVGIDFSAVSTPLVELADKLCAANGKVHLVHCWQPPHLDTAHLFGDPGHEQLYATLNEGLHEHIEQLEQFANQLNSERTFELHVITGRPASSLLDQAQELKADTIFLGAHDATGAQKLLGSVSNRVLRHAGTTVVLPHHEDNEE